MMNPSELSPEFILQIKADLEADIRLYKELPERIAFKTKRYEAALLFAPPSFDPNAPICSIVEEVESAPTPVKLEATEFSLIASEQEAKKVRVYWGGAIMSILDASGKGFPHKELRALVKASFPELPSSNGEKGFYNAIAKLDVRKRIVKHGGLLYSAKLVKDMNDRGEKLPEPDFRPRAGGSAEIVLSILREHKDGLTGPELKKIASAAPDAPRSLKDHGQYIYNILATLMGTGAVVRDNGIYKLNQAGN